MKKNLIIAALFAAVAMASYGGSILTTQAQVASTTAATSTVATTTMMAATTTMTMTATSTSTSTAMMTVTATATPAAGGATVTPSNTTTLQQQLDDAKAELVQLEMQAGQVPAGDNGTPSVTEPAMTATLSAADITSMNSALTALAGVLTSLQAKIAEDPQYVTSNGSAVVSALQGIGNTIAAIGTEMSGGNIAMATPAATPVAKSTGNIGSAASAAQAPAATTAQVTPTPSQAPAPIAATTPAPANSPTVNTTPTPAPLTTGAQTAQASSAFSFSKLNWPLIIVIILIVAAIAIWLWWDDGDEKTQPVVKKSNQQPLQPTSQVSASSNQGQNANRQPASSQTPLSSAVSPHGNH